MTGNCCTLLFTPLAQITRNPAGCSSSIRRRRNEPFSPLLLEPGLALHDSPLVRECILGTPTAILRLEPRRSGDGKTPGLLSPGFGG